MASMKPLNILSVESPRMALPLASTILTKNSTCPEDSRALMVRSGAEDPSGFSVPQAAAAEARTNKHESFRSMDFLQSLREVALVARLGGSVKQRSAALVCGDPCKRARRKLAARAVGLLRDRDRS